MTDISPRRLEAAMSAAMQVKATLPDDDDTRLLIGMLEGETEVFELLDRLAEQAIADKLLAERATERAKRIEARAERSRDVIRKMLDALELQKLERPVFTASIGYRTKAIVTDQAALPADLLRTAPDMHAIARALKDGPVAGAELSNPSPVLTLRTA
jgi:hypothetical protein